MGLDGHHLEKATKFAGPIPLLRAFRARGANALSWGPEDRNDVGSSSRTFSFPATTSSDQLELDESLVDGDVLSNRIGPDLPELDEIGPDDHLFREVTRHDEGVRDRHTLQLEEETHHLVRGESPLPSPS